MPLSTFFALVSSRAFRNAPHSRFSCRDPNQCVANFLKMLLFAFPQIYTRISLVKVYRFGEFLAKRFSPTSTFFSLVSFHTFRDAPHSRFRYRGPNQCLPNFLKMLLLALPQIYTRLFHLWKTIDLHSVWVGDSRPYQLSFLSQVLSRLEMHYTRVLGAGISTNAYLTF